MVGNEGVEAALAACADAGIQIERYLKDSGEPTIDAANTVTRAIVEDNCDAVVGIGGGSALDLAKAARLLADAGGSVWDYLEGGRPFAPPSLPLVLCPTTSGTGSEVSGASVLTDTERDRKVGVANGLMRAQHALVDPAAHARAAAGTDGALGRRRARAGDRRLHRARRQPALGGVRARGRASRRPLARARRARRLRSRRAPAARRAAASRPASR